MPLLAAPKPRRDKLELSARLACVNAAKTTLLRKVAAARRLLFAGPSAWLRPARRLLVERRTAAPAAFRSP